jgi:hypothetical protein
MEVVGVGDPGAEKTVAAASRAAEDRAVATTAVATVVVMVAALVVASTDCVGSMDRQGMPRA